ncbi:MAG: DUF5074 domain-containing protein [Muribaculum sp.]|nr:DUF5074 domain-containing protein [Muribaculaceae bacterium]MCM1081360.1 DUF5074 domain-containing protein [Muribaculum sp.]
MKISKIIASIILAGTVHSVSADDVDYTTGVFIVNEDWYGHQNSTVNYLNPDSPDGNYWHYRVIQTENPGVELGCTNQFGTIWNGRFYFIAKQDKDPGASIPGGRITVADATTMKVLHQSTLIDPSGKTCDGRAFCGVDAHKGYISTTNGIWVMDLDTYRVTGQIEGTSNPTPANLYRGQCGTMVLAGNRVFVAHQSLGLLVIDTTTDCVVDTVAMTCVGQSNGIGSVVLSKDGNLWLSVTKNTSGMGDTSPYLVRVNPMTLETKVVEITDGIYPPSNSWYAWTPDSFCASSKNNVLYWAGGKNSWFSNRQVFCYDIDRDTMAQIIDLDNEGLNWKLYGCSLRVHPVTDEIYMSLYHEFNDQTYITRRYDASGNLIREYSMIQNYWFPSIPVFPQGDTSGITDVINDIADENVTVVTVNGLTIYTGSMNSFESDVRPTLSKGLYICKRGGSTSKIAVR